MQIDLVNKIYAPFAAVAASMDRVNQGLVFPAIPELETFYSNQSGIVALVLLGLFVIFILSVAFGNSGATFWQNLATLRRPRATNLFLKAYLARPNGESVVAYLRSLDMREASVLVAGEFSKGQKIKLLLHSLPGFPQTAQGAVESEVVMRRSLGGKPEKFLLRIRFGQIDEGARRPLLDYLAGLTRQTSALHRA